MDTTAASTLRAPATLAELLRLVGDHAMVHTLASSYPSWSELVRAAGSEAGWQVGSRSAQLRLSSTPPAQLELPAGVRAVTRYDADYPAALLELPTPPVLIYLRGTLTGTRPRLAVGGAAHPSAVGTQVARAAARAAVAQGVPVVAPLVGLLGQVALGEAADAVEAAAEAMSPAGAMPSTEPVSPAGAVPSLGAVPPAGRVVAVTASGFGVAGAHDALLERIVDAGGAVLTAAAPGDTRDAAADSLAVQLAVALAASVVLAEIGLHDTAGAPLARAAIAAGRFLIVPAPQRAAHTPASAAGGPPLALARAFSASLFGTSPRIAARVANGLSPADAVVSTAGQLARAITLGCRASAPSPLQDAPQLTPPQA